MLAALRRQRSCAAWLRARPAAGSKRRLARDGGVQADVADDGAEGPKGRPRPIPPAPLRAPRQFEAEDQCDPDPWVDNEERVAVEPAMREGLEQADAMGVQKVERGVAERADEARRRSPRTLTGPSLPGCNFSQSRMIAAAGMVTRPPMPWVNPRWAVRATSRTRARRSYRYRAGSPTGSAQAWRAGSGAWRPCGRGGPRRGCE